TPVLPDRPETQSSQPLVCVSQIEAVTYLLPHFHQAAQCPRTAILPRSKYAPRLPGTLYPRKSLIFLHVAYDTRLFSCKLGVPPPTGGVTAIAVPLLGSRAFRVVTYRALQQYQSLS